MVYCLFKYMADGSKKFEGVATSKDIARAAIKDGQYLVCPINMDQRYDSDIASEQFEGAVIVKPIIVDQQQEIIDSLTDLNNFVRNVFKPAVQTAIDEIKNRLDTLEAAP